MEGHASYGAGISKKKKNNDRIGRLAVIKPYAVFLRIRTAGLVKKVNFHVQGLIGFYSLKSLGYIQIAYLTKSS